MSFFLLCAVEGAYQIWKSYPYRKDCKGDLEKVAAKFRREFNW